MDLTSVNIQGNIVSSEILEKIRNEDIKHQTPDSFGLSKKASTRDEIGMAWSILRSHWISYKKRLETLPKNDRGTSLTREKWILPLLTELGYELSFERKDIIVNDKGYSISHQAINRDNFPVLVIGYNDNLDKRRESGGPKQSPHSLVQEYLNHTEHLFALITNGKHLRLLRDATRLVRLSYLEFDLEKIMEEELYADFALLYRALHVSRMPAAKASGEEAIIEYYHQESLASGSRIRDKLSEAVENSIRTLANGFLQHRDNDGIRLQFENGKITSPDFYLHLLRLIYRVLFLIVIEERNLIYPEKRNEKTNKQREIYFSYYSVERIRRLAEQNTYIDGNKQDLWQGLNSTFVLFENGHYGKKLGIDPLGSGLFASDAIGLLHNLHITNNNLLLVIKNLTTFYDEHNNLVRVNYSDLDVEEFGSVYEGLLEYDPKVEKTSGEWYFSFVKGEGRSSSGSHYTPEELVKPLIKHSLDYIIEDKLKEDNPETALLSIRVCDVACGSGHILLSAARRIATELASYREKAEQPSPGFYRVAIRDVIKHCIYGVDLNPLAVELCKVALWLEAHNPGEPLNFLDHHIKCGNAIVGLTHVEELENGIANEAFKTLPGDDKDIASELRKLNDRERKQRETGQLSTYSLEVAAESLNEIINRLQSWNTLPENSPQEIEDKAGRYASLTNTKGWWRLKQLADIQVAQFFLSKTSKSNFITDGEYGKYLNGRQAIQSLAAALATGKATEKHFFHWFLEFPEVMSHGGFDCILGNPPFLGGQKLTGTYGNNFANYIKHNYRPIGSVDLVTYFFRRNFAIIKTGGFISLISTNTIAQGDARVGGLAVIIKQKGVINHAVRSMKWPGLAAVEVALVTIHKGAWNDKYVLDQKEVEQITSYLDNQEFLGEPYQLAANRNKSFQGSIVLGKGFILEPETAQALVKKKPKNKEVLFPYLNGQDLNNNIDQSPSRWVINFFDWEQKKAQEYPDCYEIVERLVLSERDQANQEKLKKGGKLNSDDIAKVEEFWKYLRPRLELYKTVVSMDRVLVIARVSKYVNIIYVPSNQVFMDKIVVLSFDQDKKLAILQSSLYDHWAWKNSSTLGGGTINFSPSECFETFPFPENTTEENNNNLNLIGEKYTQCRQFLMQSIRLGLTKTYNQFHNNRLVPTVEAFFNNDFQKKYGKETWNLYKHLEIDKKAKISYKKAVVGIEKLRTLHKQMDDAVLDAYGWNDIQLRHDFYEVDYLPENDNIRYTIHPEARKEVLKRLLLLNHERFEEETREGLHDKKAVEKFYSEKGQPIPKEVLEHFQKGKKKLKPVSRPKAIKSPLKQSEIFTPEETVKEGQEVTIDSCVVLQNTASSEEIRFRIVANSNERQPVVGYENRPLTDQLSLAVLNRKVGYKFKVGEVEYKLINVNR